MEKNNKYLNKDEGFDYMILEDVEEELKGESGRFGCLMILIIIILPFFALKYYV